MKVGIVGSRNLDIDLNLYLKTMDITEIISGGAKGIDTCAKNFALQHNIKLTEYKPDYKTYHFKQAPIMRNQLIINDSELLVAFWDGKSKGTLDSINKAKKNNISVIIFRVDHA
jgi:hypothetical protein